MAKNLVLALLFAVMSCQASVVYLGRHAEDNLIAPTDDPGWARVGRVGTNGSGVYLGNGWVLTANHVSNKTYFTVDGDATYNIIAGAENGVRLRNTTNTADIDLYMFRVDVQDSNLGLLGDAIISSATPALGLGSVHIGTGVGQTSTDPTYWNASWSVVSQEKDAAFAGYYWGDSSTRDTRWDYELITGEYDTYGGMQGIKTEFMELSNYGAISNNDSGSGLFVKNGVQWELAGIALAAGTYPGQPASTSVYGNISVYADLSAYSDQITSIMAIPEPATFLLTALGALIAKRRRS